MIRQLDQKTIDKIAAGEVIERPLSVVKELVENSVDAGSTRITVEIRDGGIDTIRVTDNGCGIDKDEVRTAYLSHATSKLQTAEDLVGIGTLGFRGEALSTIAAVTRTEMVTKTHDSMVGVKYVINGGVEEELTEVGAPDGTTIISKNIFYNTPARLKFLKTPMTEGSYISDLINHMALANPEIAFKLISNGKTLISTSGDGRLKETIYALYGSDITKSILPVDYTCGNIHITGYIGKPFLSKGNRSFENYFVNKRYIKSSLLSNAAELGYKQYLMQHKFPFFVLDIDVDTTALDINVHPTKMEIKFNNEELISDFLESSVEGVLRVNEMMPEVILQQESKPVALASRERGPEPFEVIRKSEEINDPNCDNHNNVEHRPTQNIAEQKEQAVARLLGNNEEIPTKLVSNVIKAQDVVYASDPIQLNLFEEKLISEDAMAKYRIVGQVFDTYWMFTYEDKLLIMDQHAAHEKIKYESILKKLKNREINSQELNPPIILTLSGNEKSMLEKYRESFEAIGYEIEDFGGGEVAIRTVPLDLYGLNEKEVFLEVLDELCTLGSVRAVPDVFNNRIATMACKAAVKGNTEMTQDEVWALLKELMTLDNPYNCPHGRPTIITMTHYELDKKFKRIV